MDTLFPYTTLFRSGRAIGHHDGDLVIIRVDIGLHGKAPEFRAALINKQPLLGKPASPLRACAGAASSPRFPGGWRGRGKLCNLQPPVGPSGCCRFRSEEHTSELQSLMRISYA